MRALAAVAAVLFLAGCTVASSATAPASSSSSVAAATPAASASEWTDDGQVTTPRPSPTLTLDASSRTDAVAKASTALTTYLRRDLSADQWWSALSPLLSQKAAEAYQGTDPARVPVARITGTGSLTPASNELAARVAIPTDQGAWLVIVSRTPEQPVWLVERFVAPEGQI